MIETILGFDIGGSKIAVLEGTWDGEILHKRVILNSADIKFESIYPEMIKNAGEIRQLAEDAGRRAVAVSVSVGGPLDIDQGVILAPPNLPTWIDVPLKHLLIESLQLPVFIEHDGNAGALAEHHFGAGRGASNLIFLTFGSGMGAGIILNGRIYRGTSDTAGEVGHIRLSPDGLEAYGKKGSWEALCSGTGLLKLAQQRYPNSWDECATPRDVIDAYLHGEEKAISLVEEMAYWLGKGIAILVDTLNPEVVVVGTLGYVLGEGVLGPARRVVEEEALPSAACVCRIVPAELGDRLGDVAALMAAISEMPDRREYPGLMLDEALESTVSALEDRSLEYLREPFSRVGRTIVEALYQDKKVLVCGNGGSAAQAQHFAGELMGRYSKKRRPLAAIALSADSASLSCIGNDFGFDYVFSRPVEALTKPGDVVLGISTSGASRNVVNALRKAAERGGISIAMTGAKGMQGVEPDHVLPVQGESAAEIQEKHLALIHVLCGLIDIVFAD